MYDVVLPTGATMQIRTRGHQVEYLRATYDPEKKRSFQKLIKPEDFTPEEKAQADAYAEKNRVAVVTERQTHAACNPALYIEMIAAGIEGGARPENEPALWESIKKMQKALRKAGIRRPVLMPKPARKSVKKAPKRRSSSKPAA